MTAYRAWIPERAESADDGFDVPDAYDARDAAAKAANWFHAHRDGWEQSWPVVFAIRDGAGRVDYFEVEREMVPDFTARRVIEGPDQPYAEKLVRYAARAAQRGDS